MARGLMDQHRKARHKDDIPVFSFDYLFLDERGESVDATGEDDVQDEWSSGRRKLVKLVVACDSMAGGMFAHVIPQKGVDPDGFVLDTLVEDIKWLGYHRVILNSDNEPAIVKLPTTALTETRHSVEDVEQAAEEHPDAYDSSGNAAVETAVKAVTGILRTNKLDLEQRIEATIPLEHPIISWLVEYGAWMLNIVKIGSDGQTANQRVRGRPYAK